MARKKLRWQQTAKGRKKMSEIATLRHAQKKAEKEAQRTFDTGDDKEHGPLKLGTKEEAFVTFACGYIYSTVETFATRFGIPFDTLTKRVGSFLSNAQRR